MTINEVQGIRDLLHRMQIEDPGFRVFGANLHKYQLGTPLPETDLAAFEQDHQVTLPADYRFFLGHVGNGAPLRSSAPVIAVNAGAGPDYGLLPLENAVLGCDLRKPFPLVASAPDQPDQPDQPGQPGQPDQSVRGDEAWGDSEAWPGLLAIGYSGCTFFSYLVVNGPARGTVWNADIQSMDFYPTGLSFEAWYLRWLDFLGNQASTILGNERTVQQVQTGMTKEQVIAISGSRWEERSYGNLRFLRFPHLATEFVLNNDDTVDRVVRHSIYMGRSSCFQPD